jgi:hypothetical protein
VGVGRLEIKVWKDTGKPRFRVWFWRFEQRTYNVCYYKWIFKVLSWYTLWVAWLGEEGTKRYATDAAALPEGRD